MMNEALTLRRRPTQYLLLILALSTMPAIAAERWESLPPTPAPIHSERSGLANAHGFSIYYAVYGQGSPVINASLFAFLQDPEFFNYPILHFLGDE
jgi:hypothetical protein